MSLSKNLLEAHLGHRIQHFAYPFGSHNEVGEREFKLAEQCGYKTAVTTQCHPFIAKDLTNIPRHSVTQNHTPVVLDTKLSGWNSYWQKQARAWKT